MKGLAAVIVLSTLCSLTAAARPLQFEFGAPSPVPAAPAPGGGSSGEAAASGGSGGTTSGGGVAETLFEKTLPLDINTASYYELLAWARRLGLSEKGSRSELQSRLRNYYKLSAESAAVGTPGQTKNERIITVKSARSAEYFTMEKIGEKYIRLSGGVDLQLYDPATDTTHNIRADTIVFNETEKSITATGNIEYVLTGKQKTEIFRGKSLTFNVDNWSGIFFEGVSQSEKTIDKNKLTFYYTGKTIRRTANDIVTLKDGTITSSDAIPPYYKVTASRIWVLAPGEWALSNAVLYLGRVPLMYFPAFFHPGDNLFFHPAVGYRDEEGYFLQTTTYLLGRRSKVNSSLSFLQVAEDTNVTYNTKIRGLFLRKTAPVTAAQQKSTPYNFEESYVKLLFDIYSRLGVFAGIESKIVDLGILQKLQFDLSVARSRDIFLGGSGYTPFLEQSDGTFISLWNDSSLFGISLPVRYGLDLELNAQDHLFSVTASVPFYSDPYYSADFGDRAEAINWSRLLGLTGSSTTTAASTARTTALQQGITSLLWSFHSTLTPDTSALAPYVSQASITAADMSMYWQAQTRSVTGVEGLDPNLANYVPLTQRSDFAFPERQFFYPQSYVLPSLSGRVSGTIFQFPAAATQAAQATSSPAPPTSPTAPSSAAPAAPATAGQTSASAPTEGGGSTTEGTPSTGSSGSSTPQAAGSPAPAEATPAATETTTNPAGKVAIEAQAPWQEPPKQQKQQAETPMLKVPEFRPGVPITAPSSLFPYAQSMTYSITPAASIENRTVSDSWVSPSQINLGKAYSIFNTRGAGSITYNGALLSNLLTVQNTLALSGNYKIHYHQIPAVTNWQSFLLQDYNATFLKLSNALTLTTFPVEGIDLLKGTNLRYSLAANLFTRTWVTGTTQPLFQNSFLSWDSSDITTHQLTSTLDISPFNQLQSLVLNFILPPLALEVDAKFVSHLGPLTTTVSGTATRPSGSQSWDYQPLTAEALFTPVGWFSLDEQLGYDFNDPGWTTSTSTIAFFNSNKSVNASEAFTYDLQHGYPTDSLTTLDLWFFNMQFEAQRTNLYHFALPAGWTQTGSVEFVPSNLSMGVNYDYKSQPLWKNRITFETKVNTAWQLNLLQFTNNALTLNLDAKLSIYKFLDLELSLQSEDRATYRYFPRYAAEVGQSAINPLSDFLDSINFFNTAARTRSNFKMQSVDFKLVHHLGPWDLTMEFTGSPQQATTAQGISYYEWNPTFTLSVQWIPVPEIKSNITDQSGQISF